MKFHTLSFYSDFSIAFAKVASYLKLNNSNHRLSKNYCTHLSGYIAGLISGNFKNIFLPIMVRINSTKRKKIHCDYSWVAEYLVKMGVAETRALYIARLYVEYFFDQLSKEKPDKIVISGDSRVQSRALKLASDHLGIQTLFFEQGPFGTTVLDRKGVNANASFVNDINSKADIQVDESDLISKQKKVSNLRIIDFLFEKVFLLLGFEEIREEKSLLALFKRKKSSFVDLEKPEHPDYHFDFLLIGQVPTDANMLLHNSTNCFFSLIEKVRNKYPDSNILFREHPLYRGNYSAELYSYINRSDNIIISHNANLDSDIQRCNHVIVVNSLTGLEVILKHRRPVLVLGEAIYGKLNAAKNFYDNDVNHNLMYNLTDHDYSQANIWFTKHYLRGHFRDADSMEFCKSIAERLNEN